MSAFGHTHLEFIFHCGTKESVLTGQKYYLDSLSESKQCARKKNGTVRIQEGLSSKFRGYCKG